MSSDGWGASSSEPASPTASSNGFNIAEWGAECGSDSPGGDGSDSPGCDAIEIFDDDVDSLFRGSDSPGDTIEVLSSDSNSGVMCELQPVRLTKQSYLRDISQIGALVLASQVSPDDALVVASHVSPVALDNSALVVASQASPSAQKTLTLCLSLVKSWNEILEVMFKYSGSIKTSPLACNICESIESDTASSFSAKTLQQHSQMLGTSRKSLVYYAQMYAASLLVSYVHMFKRQLRWLCTFSRVQVDVQLAKPCSHFEGTMKRL